MFSDLVVLLQWRFIGSPMTKKNFAIFSLSLVLASASFVAKKSLLSLSQIVMPALGWRWLLALSSVPSIILLLFYILVPESPRYLCTSGRTNDSLHVLQRIAAVNKKTLPSGVLVPCRSTINDLRSPCPENSRLPSERQLDAKPVGNMKNKAGILASIILLLSRKLIRLTLLIWMVFFGNAFSYYGIVLLTSELSIANKKCQSMKFHPIDPKHSHLYRDIFITSLAGALQHFPFLSSHDHTL